MVKPSFSTIDRITQQEVHRVAAQVGRSFDDERQHPGVVDEVNPGSPSSKARSRLVISKQIDLLMRGLCQTWMDDMQDPSHRHVQYLTHQHDLAQMVDGTLREVLDRQPPNAMEYWVEKWIGDHGHHFSVEAKHRMIKLLQDKSSFLSDSSQPQLQDKSFSQQVPVTSAAAITATAIPEQTWVLSARRGSLHPRTQTGGAAAGRPLQKFEVPQTDGGKNPEFNALYSLALGCSPYHDFLLVGWNTGAVEKHMLDRTTGKLLGPVFRFGCISLTCFGLSMNGLVADETTKSKLRAAGALKYK